MRKIILTLIIIIVGLRPVYANSMAPTSIPGKAGIYVNKESGIELVNETIKVTIDDTLDKTHYLVHYTFKNVNDQAIHTPIWFLTSGYLNSNDLKIYINNDEVVHESVQVDFSELKNWKPEQTPNYIDPYTGHMFDANIDSYFNNGISANEFELKMNRDEVTNVTIEYVVWNGYISPRVTDYVYNVKLTSYLLSPAAFYEGHGQVDIEISVLKNTLVKSNLNLEKINDQLYKIKRYSLKEDENLNLSFARKPGFTELYAMNKSSFRLRLFLLQILLLLIMRTAKHMWSKKILRWLFVLSLFAYARTAGYGAIYLVPFLALIVIILIIVFSIKKEGKSSPNP